METRHYEMSLQLAKSELRQKLLVEVAARAGIEARDTLLSLPFLNRACHVHVTNDAVKVLDSDGNEVPTWLGILTLHYLLTASGEPLTGQFVDFRQLVGGEGYLPNFSKRAADRLAREFAGQGPNLLRAGLALGGQSLEMGDVSLTLPFFPRVPITLVLWEEDDEFPASAKFLFDGSINGYLPTEDVVVACQQLVTMLQAEV